MVAAKQLRDHNVDNRERSVGNSIRSSREVRPLKRLTISAIRKRRIRLDGYMHVVGLHFERVKTMPCSAATVSSSSFNRLSIGRTSTVRRYFGHYTI